MLWAGSVTSASLTIGTLPVAEAVNLATVILMDPSINSATSLMGSANADLILVEEIAVSVVQSTGAIEESSANLADVIHWAH